MRKDWENLLRGIKNTTISKIDMKAKQIKKIFSLLVCFAVILALLALNCSAITISDTVIDDGDCIFGYYNKDIHWSVTRSTEILKIVGNGDFYYTYHIETYDEFIRYLLLNEGITSLKEGALAGLSFETITFPESLTRIESRAFAECKSIKKLVIPLNVEYIGSGAFEGCDSLTHIYIYSENIVIDEGAFPDSLNLKFVYFYGENIDIKSGNEEFSKLSDNSKNEGLIAMIFAIFICVIIVLIFVFCKKILLKTRKNMEGEGCSPESK